MIPCRIKVTERNILILSPFDNNTVIFTIWKEDYGRYRKAFDESEQFLKDSIELKKKYEYV